MSYTVFVDGAAGTTGLRIHERLAERKDIKLLILPEDTRKDLAARVDAANSADLSILCLPDEASRELVAAVGTHARICDTSTAHRTAPDWVYGFAELGGRRQSIQQASRVAVPGCHASGFLALVAPLTEQKILKEDAAIYCHSITGYSGGGKSMIAAYTDANRPATYNAPREYALSMQHKHLPEMQAIGGLITPPLFTPIVADYYSGMLVSIPLPTAGLPLGARSPEQLAELYARYYENQPLIKVWPPSTLPPDGTLSACEMSGKDSMEICVLGNSKQLLLTARFDNLGKGASGAAVQCMNLMMGCEETAGLVL